MGILDTQGLSWFEIASEMIISHTTVWHYLKPDFIEVIYYDGNTKWENPVGYS